jgi:hypothetical protein
MRLVSNWVMVGIAKNSMEKEAMVNDEKLFC